MQAFQIVQPQQPAEFREVPVPEPGPGQVLIKVGGAGARHADLPLMDAPADQFPARFPFTLGHENAGWVEKLGPGARRRGGLGQMAIQMLRTPSSATTVVAVDTAVDKLATARRIGADEARVPGDEAVASTKDITRGQGRAARARHGRRGPDP